MYVHKPMVKFSEAPKHFNFQISQIFDGFDLQTKQFKDLVFIKLYRQNSVRFSPTSFNTKTIIWL